MQPIPAVVDVTAATFEQEVIERSRLEVFQMLGDDDPLTLEYQRRLSHLLCR